jgi:transcriptional regulator with XRE-family HTH domain
MADVVQRDELATFLRARREATDPASVGFQPGPRRRTPGLRREELAQLAGVSVTWYTWLEQARDISVSRQVINSLARVLRLSETEREHVFTLAGLALPAVAPHPWKVDPLLARLVHELHPKPAYVMNPWWDLLVYNNAYASLLGGLDQRPQAERNILWITFTESRGTGLFADWMAEARSLVGQLRAHLAQYPEDPRGAELRESLWHTDTTFRQLWEEHSVSGFESARKSLRHPDFGPMQLDYVKLAAADDEQLAVIVFQAVDDESAEKLARIPPSSAVGPD